MTESVAKQLQVYELHWQIALNEYTDDGEEAVLNSYIQHLPDDGLRDLLLNIQVRPGMSMDDIRHLVIQFHLAMIDLYRTLKDEVDTPGVKELFIRLYEMEQTLTANQAWAGRAV